MFRDNLKKWLRNDNLSYATVVLIMVILPVHYYYLPPLMILLGLCWILGNYPEFGKLFRPGSGYRSLFFAFLIFYFWQVATLLYTDDLRLGWLNTFGRLSILVFSLILFNPEEKIRVNAFRLLRIFAFSTGMFTLSCFIYAFYRSMSFHDGIWLFNPHPPEEDWANYFFGTDLTYSIHPTYLAMYVLLSVYISFESWYDHGIKKLFRFGWLILGLLLSVSIYFISSRAGILASMVMISFYSVNKIMMHKKSRFIWISIIIVLILTLPLVRHNERVKSLFKGFSEEEGIDLKKSDDRIIIWKSVVYLISKNPVLGVGIGDVRSELTAEYIRVGEERLGKEKLNAHNQFLEVFLEEGIIGFAIFLLIFGLMISIAFKEKNLLYGLFILMMFIFFMFETVLYRLAGVAFFSLFSFILPQLSGNKNHI